jgi:Flp pilus assembly protein TadG
VLVLPLLVLLGLAVVQVALLAYTRATLVSAAAEGARAASLAGADPSAGVARVRSLVDATLARGAVRTVDVWRAREGGLPVVVVRVTAQVPLVGLLPPVGLDVEGRALVEGSVA